MTNEPEEAPEPTKEDKIREAMVKVRLAGQAEGKVPVPEWFDDAIIAYIEAGILTGAAGDDFLDEDEDEDEDEDTSED